LRGGRRLLQCRQGCRGLDSYRRESIH
jgi:hypothetical protein